METEQIPQYINKDMTVGDVVERYPQAAQVLTDFGLHCVGCHVSTWETVEQGTIGHGMPTEVMENMIKEANKFIHNYKEQPTPDTSGMEVEITSSAAEKFLSLMKKEGKEGQGLRIQVIAGGCSGKSYEFSFDTQPAATDKVIEKDGLKLFLDTESLKHMNGSRIDFVDTLEETGFKIDNPMAQGGCGCGKSFS